VAELRRDREWRQGIGPRLAYSSDGSAWAAGTPRGITIFEGDEPAVAAPYTDGLLGELAFAPGDRRLLAAPAAYDRDGGAWAQLPDPYEALTADLDPEAAMGFQISAGAWGADGRTLAVYAEYRPERGIGTSSGYGGPAGRLALLDGASGALETMLWEGDPVAPQKAIAIADGFVAAGGVAVGVWERPTGRPIAVLAGLRTVARTLRLSADGRYLAAGAADGAAAVWETDTWVRLAMWEAHEDECAAMAFDEHGTLATGGADGHVSLWGPDGEPRGGIALDAPVQGLAHRPGDDRLLAATGGPDAAVVALTTAV